MSRPADAHAALAAEQARLVRALLAGDAAPPDFDGARLRAGALALARKRERAVARAWASLSEALGPRLFHARFAAYAADRARPVAGGPVADGRAFARWLAAREPLPDASVVQALAVDLRHARSSSGLVPRRSPAFGAALLRESRRLVIAVRLPWAGERWLWIPVPSTSAAD